VRLPSALRALLLPTFVAAGCTVPVAGSLDDGQANRIVLALDRAGVGAEKELDPAAEGHYRVMVERDEAPRAITAMRAEDLPTPPSPGLLDSLGKGTLLPSRLAEHAHFLAGLSGELERTLLAVEGMLSARVHVSIPQADPLREGPRVKATASVLLQHRGATPPIDAHEVKRIVAGAAPGLSPEDVAVVMVPRAPGAAADRALSRLGPITATRGSVSLLRMVTAGIVMVALALLVAVLVLWSRLRRLRAVATEPPSLQQPRRSGI
jgi:type III secretion protein J